jgi:lysophospholipase L1-like esterase
VVARLPRRLRPAERLGAREVAVAYVLVLVSVLATALMMEVSLRAFRYTSDRPSAPARLMDEARTLLLDCYPSNPRGYFDLDLRAPEARARYRHLAAARRFEAVAARAPYAVEFRYNPLGFRDRPFGPRVPGVRRAVMIGDSFTEGQGVKERDTFTRVLERALNARGGERWEVLNGGRRGADFPGLYDNFRTLAPYGADVVVYAMVLNDGAQTAEFRSRQGYLNDWMMLQGRQTADGDPGLAWYNSRLWAFVRDRWEGRHLARASTRCYREMYGAPNAAGWGETQFLIRSMAEQTRAQRGRFLVALWPWLVDLQSAYPFEETHAVIRRFCEGAGVDFLDLRSALAVEAAETLRVHPVDWHPNERAHARVGAALAQRLASR